MFFKCFDSLETSHSLLATSFQVLDRKNTELTDAKKYYQSKIEDLEDSLKKQDKKGSIHSQWDIICNIYCLFAKEIYLS